MENKVINVGLYGGKSIFGGRETPLEASVVSCDRADSCSYYKNGECMALRGFLSNRCEFGSERTVKGYTSRAQKYHKFRNEWKSHEQYGKLSKPSSDKLGLIGDLVVFPYSYIRIKEDDSGNIRLERPGFGSDTAYIPLNKFSPNLIHRICSFKPQAMMGGTINDYQKKTVPLFLAHLKEVLPEKYTEFISEYKEYDKEVDYVGRKALLATIKPSVVYYTSRDYPKFNEQWYWDGEYLSYRDGYVSSFNITNDYEVEKLIIKPSNKSTIKITNNEQVSNSTVFID